MERNYRFVNNSNIEINCEFIEILNGTVNAPNRFKVLKTLRRRQHQENDAQIKIRNVSVDYFLPENNTNNLIRFFENFNSTLHLRQNSVNFQRPETNTTNQDNDLLSDTNSRVVNSPSDNRNSDLSEQEDKRLIGRLITLYETLRNAQSSTIHPRHVTVQKLIINEDFKKKLEEIVKNTYKILKSYSYERESNRGFDINIEHKISGFRQYRRTLYT
ncbi:hypothetical protein COBT_000631 [Conglomerata obtusa]